jgi:hypothetical protein
LQEGEGAVSKFHGNTGECLLGLRDIDEVKDDGLVIAEHISVCDSEKEGVADLTSCAGDCHADGLLCFGLNGARGTKELMTERERKFISTILIYLFDRHTVISNFMLSARGVILGSSYFFF